jgi:hypothetical protein
VTTTTTTAASAAAAAATTNQHSNVKKKNATTSSYKRVHVCCQATLQSNIYMGSVGWSVVVTDDAHFIHLDCFIVRRANHCFSQPANLA